MILLFFFLNIVYTRAPGRRGRCFDRLIIIINRPAHIYTARIGLRHITRALCERT